MSTDEKVQQTELFQAVKKTCAPQIYGTDAVPVSVSRQGVEFTKMFEDADESKNEKTDIKQMANTTVDTLVQQVTPLDMDASHFPTLPPKQAQKPSATPLNPPEIKIKKHPSNRMDKIVDEAFAEDGLDVKIKNNQKKLDELKARLMHKYQGLVLQHQGQDPCNKCEHCIAFKQVQTDYERDETKLKQEQANLISIGVKRAMDGTELNYKLMPGTGSMPTEYKTPEKMAKWQQNVLGRAMDGRPSRECNQCAKLESLFRCSACHFVYYCGQEHQKENRKLHKDTCRKIAAKSLVDCIYCHTKINVWAFERVWTQKKDTTASTYQAPTQFCCNTCKTKTKQAKKLFPRKIYAVCTGTVFKSAVDRAIKEHDTETEAALFLAI